MRPLERLVYSYEGITFKFPPCQAEGYPAPSISWERSYGVLNYRSRLLTDGILQIQNVRIQDEGYYICKAKNFLGRLALCEHVSSACHNLEISEVWQPKMQSCNTRIVHRPS